MWRSKLKMDEENSKHAILALKMLLAQHFFIGCKAW
jgi:hypothetical protein